MTVKVPPRGSRGAFFPRFLAAFGNRMSVSRFRKSGASRTAGGVPALLLETTGATSGQTRQAMLGYIEDGPEAWLVIASVIGAARSPAWLHNLAKQPDAVVQFGDGTRVDVRAETLEGEALAHAWERIAVEAPEYPKYKTKTDREMAVVRLSRR